MPLCGRQEDCRLRRKGTGKMAKRKRKYGLSFNLICREPFAAQNTKVIELIREMISFLEPYGDKYLECPEAWSLPHLFSHPIKYNDSAMQLIAQKVQAGEIEVYGVRDFGLAWKMKYVDIDVRIRLNDFLKEHALGYSVSMCFHPELNMIMADNHPERIMEELARTIHADYGWVDSFGLAQRSIMYADMMRIAYGYNTEFERAELPGIIPCISWWTLLNKQHIEKLGGKEAVMKNAPCFAVKDLSTDGYEAVALQLTGRPEEMKPGHYLPLREYLSPLAPPVNKYSVARLLKDPGSGMKIPDERLKLNVTEEEFAEAEKYVELSYRELDEKMVELLKSRS